MRFEAMTIGDQPAIKVTFETNEIVIMSQEQTIFFLGITIINMKPGDKLDELLYMVRGLPKSSTALTAEQLVAVAEWRRFMDEVFPSPSAKPGDLGGRF
ncbi:MAG: hypothetical protein KBD73_01425 [Candidatus Magasanikbacteria bacterium]|nr:hypothetical protein [Candidatus Magasanikbacteria bacterium]